MARIWQAAMFACSNPSLPFGIGRHAPTDITAHESLRTDKEASEVTEARTSAVREEHEPSPAMATRAWAAAAALNPPLLLTLPSSCPLQLLVPARRSAPRALRLRSRRPRPAKFVCRRAKNAGFDDYKFPDPIPEFAEQETSKFREHMAWRLEQKKEDYFGEHVEEIVDVCTEILGSFLEHDYCGPGTLLVHPFLDMKGEIKERGLPGAPQAARAAIAWAEKNIDKDWKAWTGEY